jgi:S1-C subfamily serine protease
MGLREEGEIGSLTDSIVVCDGSVEIDDIARAIVIASGRVTIVGARGDPFVVVENARRGLGIELFSLSQVGVEVEQAKKGVTVAKVLADTPFARADIRPGDRISRANREDVTDSEHLRRLVRRSAVTDEVILLTVNRGDKTMRVPVVFAE